MNNGPYFMGLIAHRTMNESWGLGHGLGSHEIRILWFLIVLGFFNFFFVYLIELFQQIGFLCFDILLAGSIENEPGSAAFILLKIIYLFDCIQRIITLERSTFSSKCSIRGSLNTCEITWFMVLINVKSWPSTSHTIWFILYDIFKKTLATSRVLL